MSPTTTDVVQRSPEQELVAQLRSETVRQQLEVVLPPTVSIDRFTRIAATAVLTNPAISQIADKPSILRAFVQAAADGLMPDGKEGAIVGRGGKAVWQPMIWGLRRQIADYGWTLTTSAVYEADEFEWVDEPHSRRHQQARPGIERGNIIGAYAIARHRDGREETLFMRWADIAKRREIATTKNVWDKWPGEMSEKTVGRALVKKLPLAEADRERLLRLIDATALADGEAANALYGPGKETSALPAATDASASGQQADGAAQDNETRSGAASSVPGTDTDGEPSMADTEGYNTPETVENDPVVVAAREAAMFVVPNGQNRDKTLEQVFEIGAKGEQWLTWALGKITDPPEYRTAVWSFCRVYLPDAYQAELARQEAQVAS